MKHTTLPIELLFAQKNAGGSRAAPRVDASAISTSKCVARIGGSKVKLVNISSRGALIENRKRISQGSSVSLQLTTEIAVYTLKGQITRCRASSMNRRVFQSAIAFDKEFTKLSEDG